MIRSLQYLPVEELEGRPHVLVDGAARPGSVLVLSHWPQSPTPAVLARDLSAQTVFAFLRAQGRKDGRAFSAELSATLAAADRAEAVTNDHFDEDGLVSVLAMVEPEFALRHEELLAEVASCGDFGVVSSRLAARIAFAVGPIAEAALQARLGDVVAERPSSWSGPRYRAVLERAVELVEHPEHFRAHWAEQDAALSAAEEDLRSGAVRIDEVPEVDLAVVRRLHGTAEPWPDGSARAHNVLALHEVALHSATSASRVLAFNGGACELYLRYESWIRYMSRRVPLRPDLGPLAEQLSAAEPSGSPWAADAVGSLVTRMGPVAGETEIDPAAILGAVTAYLESAPPAWDPFRRDGALVPAGKRRRRR